MSRETGRRFHFMKEIASGGFGAVYLTKVMHADGFSRLAAVKLLHRRWSENEEIARRMRDEARLLGWLRHRNIVDVVDLTSIDGRAAIVMEYLEAVDLKFIIGQTSIRNERVPVGAVMEIMSSVASALDAAYNRPPYPGERPLHVIHRDIKPSNIMIDETGLVKVLDFGVARADFDARESHTKELQFGSVDYMPPERLFFEPETPASDVYSLGATMYEVLTQEKLGKAKGRPERHARFLADRFSYMRAAVGLGGAEATEVERLLTQCLSFEHQNRPGAADVQKLARQVARTLPGPGLAEWSEENVGELLRLLGQQPRSPSPLTDSILSEDSKAFSVSQGSPEVSMEETLQEDAPSMDATVDAHEDVQISIEDEPSEEEPLPAKPPWMFDDTHDDSPSEAHALRTNLADQADEYDDFQAAQQGFTEVPLPEEPPDFEEPASPFGGPPSGVEPAPYKQNLRSNPTIIPELADLPPLPAPSNPFVEEIDPDLMATRVGGFDDPTLLRPPDDEDVDFEESPTVAGTELPPALQAAPVAPVVDTFPGFEPSLDDWDDVPTRIEAEPKEEKSGAARVGGSMISMISVVEEVVPYDGDGAATALFPMTPPPEREHGDDSTQLMPEDGPPPTFAPLPPSPPPPHQALGSDPTTAAPIPTAKPPFAVQGSAPPVQEKKKGSMLPKLAGGCFGLVLALGCCGGVGFGLQSGVLASFQGVDVADVELPDEVPEGPDEVVHDTPDGPDEVVPVPPVETPQTPTPVGEGVIQFVSAAPGTKKLKVACSNGKTDAPGDTVVYEGAADPKCTVTAYLEDRSRLTAIVTDVTAGSYRCFEGGEKRCGR